MARTEYPRTAIRWNEAFRDVLELTADGTLTIDYGKFDEVESLTEPARIRGANRAQIGRNPRPHDRAPTSGVQFKRTRDSRTTQA